MKRVNLLIIIASIFLITAKAQQPDKANLELKEMAFILVRDLNNEVKLQPAIQDSIKIILFDFFNEMKKSFECGISPNFKKSSLKRDSKVKKFLNEEQFKLYLKFMENKMGNRSLPAKKG